MRRTRLGLRRRRPSSEHRHRSHQLPRHPCPNPRPRPGAPAHRCSFARDESLGHAEPAGCACSAPDRRRDRPADCAGAQQHTVGGRARRLFAPAGFPCGLRQPHPCDGAGWNSPHHGAVAWPRPEQHAAAGKFGASTPNQAASHCSTGLQPAFELCACCSPGAWRVADAAVHASSVVHTGAAATARRAQDVHASPVLAGAVHARPATHILAAGAAHKLLAASIATGAATALVSAARAIQRAGP